MPTNQPKNPTIRDVFQKLNNMDVRIGALENWKIAEDAAKKAVFDYRQEEANKASNSIKNKERRERYEVYKQLGYILGLIGVALYVYLSTRGVHP
jgi:hypothetical protein